MSRRVLILVASTTSSGGPFQNLRALATQRGWHVAGEYLASPRHPGARERLLEAVQSGTHGSGVILCPSLVDIGTTALNAVRFVDEVLARGWDICTAEIDSTEATNRHAVRAVMAALSTLDRQAVADRARASLARAKREGRQLGRKRREVPVDHVRALLAAGRSWRQIAQETGIPSSTLRTALKREPLPSPMVGLLEAA